TLRGNRQNRRASLRVAAKTASGFVVVLALEWPKSASSASPEALFARNAIRSGSVNRPKGTPSGRASAAGPSVALDGLSDVDCGQPLRQVGGWKDETAAD